MQALWHFFAFLSKNLPAHTGGMYGELKAF
jgi:hypothetical protein